MEQERAGGKPWSSHVQQSQLRSREYLQGPPEPQLAAQHISSAQNHANGLSGSYHDYREAQRLGPSAPTSSYGGSSSLTSNLGREYTPSTLPSPSTSSLPPYPTSAVQPSVGGFTSASWFSPYEQTNFYSQAHAADHRGDHISFLSNTAPGYSEFGNIDRQAAAGPSDGPIRDTSQPRVARVSPLMSHEQAGVYAGMTPSLSLPDISRSYADPNPPNSIATTSKSRSRELESVGSARGTRHLACDFCRGRKLKCVMDVPNERCRQCFVSTLDTPRACPRWVSSLIRILLPFALIASRAYRLYRCNDTYRDRRGCNAQGQEKKTRDKRNSKA